LSPATLQAELAASLLTREQLVQLAAKMLRRAVMMEGPALPFPVSLEVASATKPLLRAAQLLDERDEALAEARGE
jgi:hypothetical protein